MFNSQIERRTARKSHRCTWCGESIHPGEIYERWVSIEDSIFTNRMHPECSEECGVECATNGGEYFPFENERQSTRAKPTYTDAIQQEQSK